MSELIEYFPGGDAPVEYSPEACADEGSDVDEDFDSTDHDSPEMSQQYQYTPEGNGTPNTFTLPQPSADMMMNPLQVDTDPVSPFWNYY